MANIGRASKKVLATYLYPDKIPTPVIQTLFKELMLRMSHQGIYGQEEKISRMK